MLCTPDAKPKRALLRLHLAFVAAHFLDKVEESLVDSVFYRVYFPFLLYSKPRQHTADLSWEIITKHLAPDFSGAFTLLEGCAEVVNAGKESEVSDPVEKMCAINAALAVNIAGGYIHSHFVRPPSRELFTHQKTCVNRRNSMIISMSCCKI